MRMNAELDVRGIDPISIANTPAQVRLPPHNDCHSNTADLRSMQFGKPIQWFNVMARPEAPQVTTSTLRFIFLPQFPLSPLAISDHKTWDRLTQRPPVSRSPQPLRVLRDALWAAWDASDIPNGINFRIRCLTLCIDVTKPRSLTCFRIFDSQIFEFGDGR